MIFECKKGKQLAESVGSFLHNHELETKSKSYKRKE